MIDFWAAWQPTAGPSGPEAEWDTLKALMATVALARTSPHFDDGWSLLKGDPELFQLFTDVSKPQSSGLAPATGERPS